MYQERDYYNADHVNYLVEHVVSQMDCLTKDSSQVNIGDRCKKKTRDRSQTQSILMFLGERICLKAYRFIHCMKSDKRWRNCKKRWEEHHLEVIGHGSAGKVGDKSLTHAEVQLMIKFIDNYAEANAMVSYCESKSSCTCIMQVEYYYQLIKIQYHIS